MSTGIQIDDDLLMAYADGELDAAEAASVEHAVQQDVALAARVQQHRALRARLQADLSSLLSEPVPQRLLDTLQVAAAPAANKITNKVVDIAQARAKTDASRRWSSREWSAMAASLLVGIVLGMYTLNSNTSDLVSTQSGVLLAQGKLVGALNTRLASTVDQSIRIGVSFRNHGGAFCRSFSMQDQAMAGLACREQGSWRVQMLTASDAGNVASNVGNYRQAATAIPPAILALIDQQIDGEPLDADTEAAAQRKGWQ